MGLHGPSCNVVLVDNRAADVAAACHPYAGHMLVPNYMSKVSYPAQVPVSATRSPKPNKAILGVASIVVAPTTG